MGNPRECKPQFLEESKLSQNLGGIGAEGEHTVTHTHAQVNTHELPFVKATRCPNHSRARESKPMNGSQDLPPGRFGPGAPLSQSPEAATWMGEGGKAP